MTTAPARGSRSGHIVACALSAALAVLPVATLAQSPDPRSGVSQSTGAPIASPLTIDGGLVDGTLVSLSRREVLADLADRAGLEVRNLELVDEAPVSMIFDHLPIAEAVAHLLRRHSYVLVSRSSERPGAIVVLGRTPSSGGAGPMLVPEAAAEPFVMSRPRASASGGGAVPHVPFGARVAGATNGASGGGSSSGGSGNAGGGNAGGGNGGGAAGAGNLGAGTPDASDGTPDDTGNVAPVDDAAVDAPDRSPAPVGTASAIGDFDGNGSVDLAIAAGAQLAVLHGSDRGLGSASAPIALTKPDSRAATPDVVDALAAGDFDGDGIDDLVATVGRERASSLVVFAGGRGGLRATAAKRIRLAELPGADASLGVALAVADLDADGHDDLALGFPGADGSDVDTGTIVVVRGSVQGLVTRSLLWRPDARGFEPALARGDRLGTALVAADFDGDGIDDLAAGAPGRDAAASDAGAVFRFAGATRGLARRPTRGPSGPAAGARLGRVLAAGTIDADGRADLVATIGSGSEPRRVLVHAGRDDGFAPQALANVTASDEHATTFGDTLAVADFDGDGRADLAVGAPAVEGASGSVRVFAATARGLGTEQPVRSVPARYASTLGASLVAADFDADDFSDLAVGVDRQARAALVLRGSEKGLVGRLPRVPR